MSQAAHRADIEGLRDIALLLHELEDRGGISFTRLHARRAPRIFSAATLGIRATSVALTLPYPRVSRGQGHPTGA